MSLLREWDLLKCPEDTDIEYRDDGQGTPRIWVGIRMMRTMGKTPTAEVSI